MASDKCEGGESCGLCLRIVSASDCPGEAEVEALPACTADAVVPGGLCEGDGECGTVKTANTCNGWQDVYTRAACTPAAGSISGAAGGGGAPSPLSLIAGLTGGFGGALISALALYCFFARRRRRLAGPSEASGHRIGGALGGSRGGSAGGGVRSTGTSRKAAGASCELQVAINAL